MRKQPLILLFLILSLNFLSAQNITANTTSNTNPITAFMQKQTSFEMFKFIGAPQQLANQDLILYLLLSIIILFAFADILTSFSAFKISTSWIISIGMTMTMLATGTINILYQFLIKTRFTEYTVLIIICSYITLKIIIFIFKKIGPNKNKKQSYKVEERAQKIKTSLDTIESIGEAVIQTDKETPL